MVVISHTDPKEYIGSVVCLCVKDSDFVHFLKSACRSMVNDDSTPILLYVHLCKFIHQVVEILFMIHAC